MNQTKQTFEMYESHKINPEKIRKNPKIHKIQFIRIPKTFVSQRPHELCCSVHWWIWGFSSLNFRHYAPSLQYNSGHFISTFSVNKTILTFKACSAYCSEIYFYQKLNYIKTLIKTCFRITHSSPHSYDILELELLALPLSPALALFWSRRSESLRSFFLLNFLPLFS